MKLSPFAVVLAAAPLFAAAAKTPAAIDSDAPWKVEEAHGPSHAISFTTDEGTWLSADVHPDGQRVVFSLLGDLYLLPLAGGEARRITSGPAYDVQPRFSPDGKQIAFASDRGGTENLWLCDLEGKHARAISSEKDAFVNSPAWSPDGEWLVGRKRLTDTSSLGTVELWMWHVKGGQGIQLTKKDSQADAADPAFSPDGRFLYFSARPGRYEYSQNVNNGIWQIKRLDRKTGQATPLTGEFGGAAAPTPSPDGKQLAFVRRVRGRTRLELMEISTGRVRTLAPEVERDNQEGFAFHGVYPGYGWTPDSKALVATAAGKLWRFDAETGARTPIAFTAAVEQRVTDALRFPRRLDASPVRARIVRWPVESPDGKRLVFQALGHLYGMDLPKGKPQRLTTLDDPEFSPAFSRDGSELTFVTWNDREGGHVWTLAMTPGSQPHRVSQQPAQYANPAFSPDARRIVVLRGSGATFRDQDPADELWQEIRWLSVDSGESHLVASTKNRGPNRRMARPAFSTDGERILFLEDEEPSPHQVPKSVLVSIRPDGTDRRVHLRFTQAEEAVVSPDGRQVAFRELHNAYVTALPDLGAQTVDVTLEGAALPVNQLTDEGGEWLGFADGGRSVSWIFGATYHRLAVDKALPMPDSETPPAVKPDPKKAAEAKPKPKPLPKPEDVEIVLEVPRARPTELVAYTGARVVTMRGDEVIENATLLVEGNRIKSVGPTAAPPAGARVVDLAGRTVIPGLFDEHAHLHYSALDILPQRPWKYQANLAYGVTTTHDPSASTHEALGQSELVEAGLMTGPRIFSTGYILYGADDPNRALIKSLDDARHAVRRLKAQGAFTVKSYMQPRREQRQWLIQAAREEQMMVVPEGGGDLEADMSMVLDGHTTIEHALPFTPLRKDVVTLFGRCGTSYTPTLLVAYSGLSGDLWFHQHYELWKDERLQRFVPQRIIDTLGRIRGVMATDPIDWHHVDVAASALEVVRAGGRVNLGGHGQMQGLGPHWEMWAFVQGGMTPLQALRVATLAPAQTLGLDADLGSLEPGKLADFVVLEKNPLEKIENSETVEMVVKNGTAYLPKDLALSQQ